MEKITEEELKKIKSQAHKKPNAFEPLSPRKTALSPRIPMLYIKNPTIAPTGITRG